MQGVIVLINSRPGKVNPVAPFNTSALTTKDGSVTLTSVPDGTYSVCPHPPTPRLLPPCDWMTTEPRATVENGQAMNVAPITLQPAVDFYVRVNDPQGKRSALEGKTPGTGLFLAVRAPNGRIFPIPMTTKDATGSDHHLSVPAETDLDFTVSSSVFSISDNLSRPIGKPNTAPTRVSVRQDEKQHREVININ